MCQSLPVGTDFVLALYDQDASRLQHPQCLCRTLKIQVQHSFVVFLGGVTGPIVAVVLFVILMILVSCAAGCMHIRRVKHDAVNRQVAVR